MRFACQSCGKAYNLPKEKIASKSNVKLKCRVCGAIVEVKKQGKIVAKLLGESLGLSDLGSAARVSEAPPPLASGAPEAASRPAPRLSPISSADLPPSTTPDVLDPTSTGIREPAPQSSAEPPPLSGSNVTAGAANVVPNVTAGAADVVSNVTAGAARVGVSDSGPSRGPNNGQLGGGFGINQPPDDDEDEATAPAPPVSPVSAPVAPPPAPPVSAADAPSLPTSEPDTVADPAAPSNISGKMLVAAFLSGFVIDHILVKLGWF